LYPAPLRDLLLSLAAAGIYRAKWTETIHDEWTRNLLEKRPELDQDRIKETRTQMNVAVPDSLVKGYEDLIDALTLKDPDDRHVLAAAIRCNADSIVTFNQKDFDEEELKKYDLYTEHPDEFVSNMIAIDTPRVVDAVREQRARLKNPPKTVDAFLSTLHGQGLPQTVNALSKFAGSI
jgi:predicted nucleic acid-binding protein